MKLDISMDFEDKSVKGPCPFRLVKEGEFHCFMKIEGCRTNGNNLSNCGNYGRLLEKWLLDKIRVVCSECGGVEIEGYWYRKNNVVIQGIKYPILPEVWQETFKFAEKIPFCPEC